MTRSGFLLAPLLLGLTACAPATAGNAVTPSPTSEGGQASSAPAPLSFTAGPADPTATAPPPIRLGRITSGGCCPYPFWSADSRQVLFLDGPPAREEAGVYAVGLEGGSPTPVRAGAAALALDGRFWVYREGRQTVIERAADGERWTPPVGGRAVLLSPSGEWIAWDDSPSDIRNLDRRPHEIWVSRLDGSEAQAVVQTEGGGLVGWGGTDEALLVAGKIDPADDPAIWRVALSGDPPERLYRAQRTRSTLRSPQGGWLAVLAAFGEGGGQNGLWLVPTVSGRPVHLPVFGGYRWRGEGSLLVLAWGEEDTAAGLWQVEAPGGEARLLFGEEQAFLPVANNDWAVSPDGRWLVFLSSEDWNLWLVELP